MNSMLKDLIWINMNFLEFNKNIILFKLKLKYRYIYLLINN